MNKTHVEIWLPMVETTEANVSQQWDTLCIITKYVRSLVMDTVIVSLEASHCKKQYAISVKMFPLRSLSFMVSLELVNEIYRN